MPPGRTSWGRSAGRSWRRRLGNWGSCTRSHKMEAAAASLPLPACGERSEFAHSLRKFRVRGPLRESEPVERPPPPPPPPPPPGGGEHKKPPPPPKIFFTNN